MERLHDPSMNAYGRFLHVYSPCELGKITKKISDDEWTALRSVIAKTMLERILNAGYGFGKVTTRAGNGCSHKRGRAVRPGRRFEILTGLFRDLGGILMPLGGGRLSEKN
jgi:hypothetical protein